MYLLQSGLRPQGQRPGLVGAPGGLACHRLVSEAGHEAGDGHHQTQHRGRVVLRRGRLIALLQLENMDMFPVSNITQMCGFL